MQLDGNVPTLEDKILQRAVSMLLEPIYEQDFSDGSYGFRPGRSAHAALELLWQRTMDIQGGWILEVDIRKLFDTLDHGHLRSFVKQRVCDGVLLRLIGQWVTAGVMEDGRLWHPDSGSPLLANVYLHHVLDPWLEEDVKPRLTGQIFLIRYADDFVLVFTEENDARRVEAVLPKRFGKYGLTVHPTKTRLIDFRRPCSSASGKGRDTGEGPGTFTLLGFTHYWGRSRKGKWGAQRKTASSRLSRAVRSTAQWCRSHRHDPIGTQQATLSQKLRGHYASYGITGNSYSLSTFSRAVHRAWRKWLTRRHRKRTLTWPKFKRLLERYPLPAPRVVHSVYATQRP